MFSDFRKKFTSVIQEGRTLSENLSNTYIRQTSSATGSEATTPTTPISASAVKLSPGTFPSSININAGCSYLEEQKQQWEQTHEQNEINATEASRIDEQIHSLQDNTAKTVTSITDLNVTLSSIPSINEMLKRCVQLTQSISVDCAKVEQGLFELEDLIEVLDLQEKQIDHKFEMAMYKEKKLAALDRVRQELVDKHAANVRQFEQTWRSVQQERQAVFQDAFQNDLNYYKESGTIPKVEHIVNNRLEITLEEIVLDTRDDSKELDDFLNN